MLSTLFSRRRFADLPGWGEADPAPALDAFRRSAPALLAGSVATGALGLSPEVFRPAAQAATNALPKDAKTFFEAHFAPALIVPDGEGTAQRGFLTGYYEPEIAARLQPDSHFRVPLYRRPDDLVAVDDVSRPPGLDRSFAFARRRPGGLLDEYPDRAAIETGALAGRGLELAWLADPVDAFFIHVQGSARLALPGGRTLRVGYAAKTGHPFTAIGRLLVEEGELTLEEADMTGIRAWAKRHPERAPSLLRRNRSFIFFRAMPEAADDPGPRGAAGVPLTPLASLAVDRALHTFGTPIFADAPTLDLLGEGKPFRRLLVAQDTGSAILGPARGDIFVGSGEAAGRAAGRVRHRADLYALLPRAALGEAAP